MERDNGKEQLPVNNEHNNNWQFSSDNTTQTTEPDNYLQEQIPAFNPPPKKKKRFVKKILLVTVLALVVYIAYSVASIFLSPDRYIQQIYLIPEDAAIIIQSSNPVNDWKKFSSSETWASLKKAKTFEDVTRNVEMLDSVIQGNKTLLSLVGKRDLLMSLHKTRATDWDFLIVLDMQKMSKLNMLKDQIENILSLAGSTVTSRTYNGINILEMRDPDTRDILYIAFVDNHVVVSFTAKLIESSIDSRANPKIGLNYAFIESEKLVSNKGLCRLYINYAALPQFMSLYMDKNEYFDLFSNSMDFAGLYFDTDKHKLEMKGYTFGKENADPFVGALLKSGKHKMKAHEVMSARTAFYTNIGVDNPQTFVKELETIMAEKDKQTYDSYASARRKIENFFDISLDENFLSWMSGEFAISQSEPGLLGQEPELILAIGAKNIKDARKNMEYIEKKIKRRSPIKIKAVQYNDFEINYIELKGFFRLFFGKLFDSFEKPYYTYVGDYVVLSNKSSSLLSFIADYEQKNILKNDEGFKKVLKNFNSNSTLFVYTDMHKFYSQLPKMLNAATWAEIQSNKNVLYSFPYWTMQVVSDNQSASLQYIMDHEAYVPKPVVTADSDETDTEMDENADTEKELMSELKRFYVEKFQGNVLREFYADGELKSESEVKDGKRHGRYREYYINGKLKTRGKYQNNRQKGTWKHYTEDGEFDRKEKF